MIYCSKTHPFHFYLERLEPRLHFSTTPASTAADLVAQANNAFAFELFQQLNTSNSGNTFFSPYSVASALEMTLQGAKGTTASEIIQTLDLPSTDIADAGIQALYQLFQATPATAGYTLSTANRLWINQNISVLQSFLTANQNLFGADPQSLDFSNPTAAANTINAWVAAQTNNKIQDLIPAADLNSFTALVLTNAIYFKGNWAEAFDPKLTANASFQVSPTQSSTVSMMQQTNDFGYYAQPGANGFQALDLPYEGNNLDMLVILPTASNIDSFESSLTPDLFNQIGSNLAATNVDVDLPKFQLNETYNLIPALSNMGIHAAFSNSADFSGISPLPLSISTVVQKSFINVDETGTEAAAATGVGISVNVTAMFSPPVTFDADHPFIFAIRDRVTNTILFLGRITDPSNQISSTPTNLTAPSSPPTGAAVAAMTSTGSLFAPVGTFSFSPGVTQTLFPSSTNSQLLD